MMSALSTIWENTNGCTEQYICATALYLMSVLSQRHSIIFDQVISAPGHGKELIDDLNATEKRYMYQFMSTVQLPGSKIIEKHILMHSCTKKEYVSLDKEFHKHLSNYDSKHGVIYQGKDRKIYIKRKWTDREYDVQDNDDVAQKICENVL